MRNKLGLKIRRKRRDQALELACKHGHKWRDGDVHPLAAAEVEAKRARGFVVQVGGLACWGMTCVLPLGMLGFCGVECSSQNF